MRILGGIEKRKEWTEDRLRAALAVLDIKKSGPAPNFWEAEGAIFAQKVGLLGVTALGMSMRQQQAELRSTQRDMGERMLKEHTVDGENLDPKLNTKINKLINK